MWGAPEHFLVQPREANGLPMGLGKHSNKRCILLGRQHGGGERRWGCYCSNPSWAQLAQVGNRLWELSEFLVRTSRHKANLGKHSPLGYLSNHHLLWNQQKHIPSAGSSPSLFPPKSPTCSETSETWWAAGLKRNTSSLTHSPTHYPICTVSTTFWHLTIHNPDSSILRQSTQFVPTFLDPFVPGCSSRGKLMLRKSGK